MKFLTHIWNKHRQIAILILAGVVLVSLMKIFAADAPPSGGFAPGATLDPACLPGATDCVVTIPTGWGLTGNAGTTAGTDFVGTTDDVSLMFKVNGIKSGFIDAPATGLYNTSFGLYALNSITSGQSNTALGYNALVSNTSGGANTAIGIDALSTNSNGNFNTAIGLDALFYNTAGSYNTANGNNALFSNVAGSKATAIGVNAMQYAFNTTIPFDNSNVAIGFEALRGSITASANSGNYNTAVGYQTLRSNTEGVQNNTLGYWALYSNTTGSSNNAIGTSVLQNNTTGSSNTASGLTALFYNTEGSNNTAYGYQALISNTTENDNTALGYNADVLAGFTNSTAIGANAIVGASNSIVLGDSTTPINVGIGTASPSSLFHIKGSNPNLTIENANEDEIGKLSFWTGGSETFYISQDISNSQVKIFEVDANPIVFGVNNTEKMRITSDSNVGIGTATPAATLDVNGSIYVSAAGEGYILKSPDGLVCKKYTIDNSGDSVATSVACP